jgi:subtilisin family serine protease
MIREKVKSLPSNIQEIEWEGKQTLVKAGRIVVKLKDAPETAAMSIDDIMRKLRERAPNVRLVRPPKQSGRLVLACRQEDNVVNVSRALSEDPAIAYAEPDFVGEIAIVPSDVRYGDQWGPPLIRADEAWDLETGASNVIIGIVDTGISITNSALDHPDLHDSSRYLLGTNYISGGEPRDDMGHGTHVAGIAAAKSNNAIGIAGINWLSQAYICKVFDSFGFGVQSDTADAIEEIVDYAVSVGKKAVINLSARWTTGGNTLSDACKYVNDHGMILCAATGNDSSSVGYPARYSPTYTGVIAVGSVNSSDNVSTFSNTGPEVVVVAPGEDILSTTPTYPNTFATNYDFLSGTSMATPHVTGVVSLMWSRHPSFASSKIRSCLTDTAVKLGPGNFDNAWGFGRVDARKALQCGDLVFTTFTKFTIGTVTKFTLGTVFTKFTLPTMFTKFTLPTKFTGDPGPLIDPRTIPAETVRPFVRFMDTVFDPQELDVRQFEVLGPVAETLRTAGLSQLHQIAMAAPEDLARKLGWEAQDGHRLHDLAAQLLGGLVKA